MSQKDMIVNNLELTQLISLFVFRNLIVQSVHIQYSIEQEELVAPHMNRRFVLGM